MSTALGYYDYENRMREYLPGHRLYMREADFLAAVGEGGRTMTEVADELGVSQAAATQLAARLEAKRLIARERDPDDRRSRVVTRTPLGDRLNRAHAAYDEGMRERLFELLGGFSDADIAKFLEYEELLGEFLSRVK